MNLSSAGKRILGAFVGNSFARVTRIAEQLFIIPLLLSAWGADRFGEWTVLTSIATLVYIANFGIGQAALSDIVLRYAADDKRGAARTLVTSICLTAVVVITAGALLATIVTWLDPTTTLSLHSISAHDARLVILILGSASLIGFFEDPLTGAISSAVGLGPPNMLTAIAKATEIIAIAITIQFSATPVFIASIMFGATLFRMSMYVFVAHKVAPWISFQLDDFDIRTLTNTWRASLSYFSIIICMSFVYVQVPRLVVFHYFGPLALTTFTVLFAYTRAGRMLVLMVPQAAQVEVSRAFGQQRIVHFRRLIETVQSTTISLATILIAAEVILAPFIIPIWTGGHISITWTLLAALALVALAGSNFDALFLSSSAINRVSLVAFGYATGLAIGLLTGLLLSQWWGPTAVAITLLVPELSGSWAALRTLNNVVPGIWTGMFRLHLSPWSLFSGKLSDEV